MMSRVYQWCIFPHLYVKDEPEEVVIFPTFPDRIRNWVFFGIPLIEETKNVTKFWMVLIISPSNRHGNFGLVFQVRNPVVVNVFTFLQDGIKEEMEVGIHVSPIYVMQGISNPIGYPFFRGFFAVGTNIQNVSGHGLVLDRDRFQIIDTIELVGVFNLDKNLIEFVYRVSLHGLGDHIAFTLGRPTKPLNCGHRVLGLGYDPNKILGLEGLENHLEHCLLLRSFLLTAIGYPIPVEMSSGFFWEVEKNPIPPV